MITHRDLFSGNLGKLKHIGGSRSCATPNTAIIPPQYSITVNYNIQGYLIAHSLDGRLWLYRRSKRLGVIALKWNGEDAKLEYAAAKNISNNDDVVLACGFDWILTNNNIFMVSDEEPYILSSNLFDADTPDNFLYSILRSSDIVLASGYYSAYVPNKQRMGLDPFTNQPWGKRDDNGNSEGKGYFSKNTYLLYPAGTHSFEQCYSLLPSVGDWQIFENFLVRRPDASSSDSYNYMHSLRPLIPLEFCFANLIKSGRTLGITDNGFKRIDTAAYGTGYNLEHRGIQLIHRDGQLWGRGLYNIGQVLILPAVFGENGEVLEYYLYISPDFPCSPFLKNSLDVHDDWLNISIAVDSNSSAYGFLSQQDDNLSGIACFHAREPKLFLPQSNEWEDFSDNNANLFVDALSSSGLVLHDKGATFLINNPENLESPNLKQWLVPAGKLEAINAHYVAASTGNSVFLTSRLTGLNRFCFSSGTIPLTADCFTDSKQFAHRLSISESTNSSSRKVFSVNSFVSGLKPAQSISWQSVYKHAVSIELLNSFTHGIMSDSVNLVWFVGEDNECSEIIHYDHYKLYSSFPIFVIEQSFEAYAVKDKTEYDSRTLEDGSELPIEIHTEYLDTRKLTEDDNYTFYRNGSFVDFPTQFAVPTYARASVFFIDPNTGTPSSPISVDVACQHRFITFQDIVTRTVWGTGGPYPQDVDFTNTWISYIEIPQEVAVCNGKLGWVMEAVDHSDYFNYNLAPKKLIFKPVMDIPDSIVQWCNNFEWQEKSILYPEFATGKQWEDNVIVPQLALEDFSNPAYPIFRENITKTIFALNVSSEELLQLLQNYPNPTRAFDYTYSLSSINAYNNVRYGDNNLHVAVFSPDEWKGTLLFIVFRSHVFNDAFDFNAEFERSKLS